MIRYPAAGLSDSEVAESRRRHGSNVIAPPREEPAWKLLAEKFRDPIIKVLLLAAVIPGRLVLLWYKKGGKS